MRKKTIKVSKDEKEILDKARKELFESDSVPYGEVIEKICNIAGVENDG